MPNLTWSDDLSPLEKELYMAQVAILKLTDHITTGAKSIYGVYADDGSWGQTEDYQQALKTFEGIPSDRHPYIALWTRIGTMHVMKQSETTPVEG